MSTETLTKGKNSLTGTTCTRLTSGQLITGKKTEESSKDLVSLTEAFMPMLMRSHKKIT